MHRRSVWNDGPRHDLSQIPKRKRQPCAPHASTSTKRERSSRRPESKMNRNQNTGATLVSSFSQDSEEMSVQLSITLDTFTSYVSELRQESAVTMCDATATVFVLPAFNEQHSKLTARKYHFVERCTKLVGDTYEWFYCCSCSQREQDLVMSLSSGIVSGAARIHDNYCMHIRALMQIVDDWDEELDITPSMNEEDHNYTIPPLFADIGIPAEQEDALFKVFGDGNYCIRSDGVPKSYGILNCSKNITCLTCSRGSNCSHVKKLKYLLATEDQMYSASTLETLHSVQEFLGEKSRSIGNPVCQSSKQIAFKVKPGQFLTSPGYNPYLYQDNGMLTFVSHEQSCPTCESALTDGPIKMDVPLITRNHVFKAKVHDRTCETCQYSVHFDGGAEAILNMGTFLVSHEVLRDYMYHFFQTGMTMFGYHQTLQKHMEDAGIRDIQQKFSYNKFRFSWYSFEELLDIQYDDGFMCTVCGPAPKVVIGDGTALSFRRELLPWQQVLQERDNDEGPRFRGSSHQERVFVNNARGRKLLQTFVTNQIGAEEMEELQRSVPLSLIPLLKEVQEYQTCPDRYKGLIKALSKNSPACGLLHPSPELHKFVEEVTNGASVCDSVTKMEFLQKQMPFLFDVMRHGESNTLPDVLRPLLVDLLTVAEKPFLHQHQVPDGSPQETNDTSLSFFPGLPLVRSRGKFVADGKQGSEKSCSKSAKGHPSLLPGMFLLHCEHGINYGFQVMLQHESPNTPFTILRTRFKKVPDCVIYDNSCNLHSYCLNRDPLLFKHTWFLVDRLHWKNHKGCSVGYKMAEYPQYDFINSQVVEQCNAALKKLKGQLSYMTPANFIRQAKLFLWHKNMTVASRM